MFKHLIFIMIVVLSANMYAQNTVEFNNPHLLYEGRIVNRPNAAELTWPGTSVTIRFKGTELKAIMQDLDTANYYNVIVDHQVMAIIHPSMEMKSYELAAGLSDSIHEVQLFKRTEWDKGKTLFFGFELAKDAQLLPPPASKKRKIEFYGNSITCGYGNEDSSGQDRGFGYFQNNYETYAAITARHFDATYFCNAKSGIGITVSWFPLLMSEMYDRADPTDSLSKWDFTKYTPDLVVINLFQNDSWIVTRPDNEQFQYRFGTQAPDSTYIITKYKEFVSSIRGKYPQASIICALGSMDATREGSVWPGYIQSAVKQMNDPKVYTTFFPFKNTCCHPSVAEQHAMADQLIRFIEKNIQW